MKAKTFDKKFDENSDVIEFLDLSKATRPNKEQKRVNVDFPYWMVVALDREASRLGITRQALVKFWIAQQIKAQQA